MKEETKELIIIKQLPIIEENLKKLSENIESDVKNALSLEVNEDTVKDVKKTRTRLNNDFKDLETQRKFVKEKVLAPYMAFEEVYKTYVSDKYKNADLTLKNKVDEVENKLKAEKEKQVIEYFEELITKENIDFIKYDQLGIKVGLSNSLKSLKDSVKEFIDKTVEELNLIETQEYKSEILVEYKQTLNIANAITSVNNRMKAIEEEKTRQEELSKQKAVEVEVVEKVEEFTAPVVIEEAEIISEKTEELLSMSFKVSGTLEQLKGLKNYMESVGIEYESI